VDVVFINCIPFLVSISRHLRFGTIKLLHSHTSRDLLTASTALPLFMPTVASKSLVSMVTLNLSLCGRISLSAPGMLQ
jgi:hypothetical protein